MSSETAHSLVMRRHPDKPIKLATVKRALRTLRDAGLADADDHYDRKKNRLVAHWWATDFGIRANLDRG